jgi:hypothetical protein
LKGSSRVAAYPAKSRLRTVRESWVDASKKGAWLSTLRGFHLIAGGARGDHDVATYFARVSAMKREFPRFAADRSSAWDIR